MNKEFEKDDPRKSGFPRLAEIIEGSELTVLCARPFMAKSILAVNIGQYLSINHGLAILFFSLEMSASEVLDKMTSFCGAAENCSQGRYSTNESRDRLPLMVNETSKKYSVVVDDSASQEINQIYGTARRLMRRNGNGNGLGLIVIDYLQLIEADKSCDPQEEKLANIARQLKSIAKELGVPVLCLCALSPATDDKDHRPTLRHLRELGRIEPHADVVMFLHRDEYYCRDHQRMRLAGEAEIIVAKHNHGPVGEVVELLFEAGFNRFSDRNHTN